MQIKGVVRKSKVNVIYCRVSSAAQRPELKNQSEAMTSFCMANGVVVDRVIEEIGGGLNFKRKKFLSLLTEMMTGQIGTVYIAHKDRLCRFAFDLVEHLAKVNGCSIVVANNQYLSPQQEVVEDLMAIIHCFSCRLYGSRSYKESFKKNLDKNLDTKLRYKQDEIQC
jgi:predicted site-specific integrase-resolvase